MWLKPTINHLRKIMVGILHNKPLFGMVYWLYHVWVFASAVQLRRFSRKPSNFPACFISSRCLANISRFFFKSPPSWKNQQISTRKATQESHSTAHLWHPGNWLLTKNGNYQNYHQTYHQNHHHHHHHHRHRHRHRHHWNHWNHWNR